MERCKRAQIFQMLRSPTNRIFSLSLILSRTSPLNLIKFYKGFLILPSGGIAGCIATTRPRPSRPSASLRLPRERATRSTRRRSLIRWSSRAERREERLHLRVFLSFDSLVSRRSISKIEILVEITLESNTNWWSQPVGSK